MRIVLERVESAEVKVNGEKISEIKKGLLLFVCIYKDDTPKEIRWAANKVLNLRIFEDDKGKLNLSVSDIKGEILAISNFTLCGDVLKGNRPSFDKSEEKEKAEEKFDSFVSLLKESGLSVKKGKFGAFMEVYHINSGPVTIIIDTKEKFKKGVKDEEI